MISRNIGTHYCDYCKFINRDDFIIRDFELTIETTKRTIRSDRSEMGKYIYFFFAVAVAVAFIYTNIEGIDEDVR